MALSDAGSAVRAGMPKLFPSEGQNENAVWAEGRGGIKDFAPCTEANNT